MTKQEFFAALTRNLKFHNANGDRYVSADYRAEVFNDPRENAPSDWIHHGANIVLADCWFITFTTHRTAEAAERQTAIFARWLAEWQNGDGLEVDAEQRRHVAALVEKRAAHTLNHAAREGKRIALHDARRLVRANTDIDGGWSYSATMQAWQFEQEESQRCHLLNLVAQKTDPELAQEAIARASKLTGPALRIEYAFHLARFCMTADELIAVVSNGDEDDISRRACSVELFHRCGPVTNVAACSQ